MPDAPSTHAQLAVSLFVPPGAVRDRLAQILRQADAEVDAVDPGADLWVRLRECASDLVLVRRTELTAADLNRMDRQADAGSGPSVVVLSDRDDPADEARLVAQGALHVLSTHTEPADLQTAMLELVEGGRRPPTPAGGRGLPEPRLSDFVSHSHRMNTFIEFVRRIADTDATLLVMGETGVGKEHLARAIHAESRRRAAPFVAVNCGALPETLLESELFGHEKGSFTGAVGLRRGQFEMADGGTLLLDEIGEMPRPLQVKLLSVLQRRELRRVGGERPIPIDVRVMAATNRDLGEDVANGTFREDLFYRLNVVPLTVPPLRERMEDLPSLIGALMRHYRHRLGRPEVRRIQPAALTTLLRHDWPGNVRELLNVIERAMLIAPGDEIRLEDLPSSLGGHPLRPDPAGGASHPAALLDERALERPLAEARRELLDRFEQAYLDGLLRETRGVIGETAGRAGISPRSLYDKMRRHGLRKEDYKR